MIIFAHDFSLSVHFFFDQMTKVLFLVRHAQSAGKQSGQHDYERKLTPLGKNNSHDLGKKIKKSSFQVDFILASAATRAVETVKELNKSLGLPDEKIQFKTELYEALTDNWVDAIRSMPDTIHVMLLVGHNPGISMVTSTLSGQNIDLAPCALAGIEIGIESWKEFKGNRDQFLNHIVV